MKKMILLLIFLMIFMDVNAVESNLNEKEIILVTKYYKTIFRNGRLDVNDVLRNTTKTIEISQSEYENASVKFQEQNLVETTYKKLISSISKNGNYFRYKAELQWKNIPSTRSYDIIDIGFYSNVSIKNNTLYFSQEYCTSSNDCYNSFNNYSQIFTNGVGTSFKLPSGNLNTLKQVLYFDVIKNTSNTITSQIAVSDYSHATSNVSLSNSQKYIVNTSGIVLNGVSSYYDDINSSKAIWSGKW